MSRLLLALVLSCGAVAAQAAGPSGSRNWCGTSPEGSLAATLAHRERAARDTSVRSRSAASAARVGQIAVLNDAGDLALPRNDFDLQGAGFRYTPNGSGYDVARVDVPVGAAEGARLPLGDDDTLEQGLPFAFPYYGRTHDRLFVNSDGNVTFDEGDGSSASRDLGRFVAGAPRVAPLFTDLDPTSAGGVYWSPRADRVVVTWSEIPRFGESDRNTLQLTLWADGRIEMAYGTNLSRSFDEGVSGLSPGRGENGYTPLDLSTTGAASAAGAVGESFRAEPSIDTVAVARRFYQSFGDDYDQLVVFTNRALLERGTFAYEQTVQNQVAGLGQDGFSRAADYGSGGRLQSFAYMDNIAKYPADPLRRFLGEDHALSLVGHESGHRWLAQGVFTDGAGNSTELLGRDDVHWSFFFDSDGSFMEGNEITDLGGGQFRTEVPSQRYSALDQYFMGLRAPEEVPAFFFVRSPTNTTRARDDNPESAVRFAGTRREVGISEVIAAMGPRSPAFGEAPRVWRQAWIFVSVGGPPSEADLAKVEAFRAAWEPFYAASTEGRGAVEARLD
jgi:hypothetical protein